MANGVNIPEGATVKDLFEQLGKRLPEAEQKFGDLFTSMEGILQFDITGEGGGKWYMEFKSGKASVTEGAHESPTTTFTVDAADWLALSRREADPQQLFMSGRLKVAGDMGLAMKLGQFMRQAMEAAAAPSAEAPAAPAAEAPSAPAEAATAETPTAPAEEAKIPTPEEIGVTKETTVAEFFEKIMPAQMDQQKEKVKTVLSGVSGILQFDITGEGGGKYVMEIKDGEVTVSPGENEAPTTTFTVDAGDWMSMARREADPQQLFMSGRLKVAGDMSLAMKLGQIVRSATEQQGGGTEQQSA
jgi:3-hydroxyacyl-CoA dehydrogenase/3a,7a,12a-trihydroxy-5b-cholest-24-enoyl-CoA hydratase